jgi:hypothetical protein
MKNMKRLLIIAALAATCAGCVYRGAKITEGVNLIVGLSVPGTDGALQINALDWCTGFRMGVAENAAFKCRYVCATTNSFFGIVHTECYKTIDAEVNPCEVSPAATNAVEEVASE